MNDELICQSLVKNSNSGDRSRKTDIICELINYISLIPTLAYNTMWFIYLRLLLEELDEKNINKCFDINRWLNYCFAWIVISVVKALFFLCFVRICFGSENDCNIFCLILKAISGLIGSIVFVLNIPDYITNTYTADTPCYNIEKSLSLFYKCEYCYILFVLSLFCLIPLGACLMGVKEYIKSTRRYKTD